MDGSFGSGTYSAFSTISSGSTLTNQIYIIQGALYCKGYDPNGFDGSYGSGVVAAIKELESDAGLSTQNGIVTATIMKSLLTMNAYVLLTAYDGDENIRTIQQYLNNKYSSNSVYGKNLGLVPCDGVYASSTNKALLYAFQIEEGLSDVDGIWGTQTKSAAPTLSTGSSKTAFVYLLQFLLYLNEFDPNGFDGGYGSGVKSAVAKFQAFCALDSDGICGPQTWASLLVSTGDTDRQGTCCDCATTLTATTAQTLIDNGYEIVGRYLTGSHAMTSDEIEIIFNAGLKLMPIFEVMGYVSSWFTALHGEDDANDALDAAIELGIPEDSTIYFAVDYDVDEDEISTNIAKYFAAVKNVFKDSAVSYNIGIYAPRYVCTKMSEAGYTTSSFVCDMSTGFQCNIGHTLPEDWAFDQIVTKTVGSGTGAIEIDNNISSGTDTGVSSVEPIFISLLEQLAEYAVKYIGDETDIEGINRAILDYLRSDKYGDEFWAVTVGDVSDFVDYMESNYSEFNDEMSKYITAEELVEFKNYSIDLPHLAAATLGYCDSKFFIASIYTGWAGDLASIMPYVEEGTGSDASETEAEEYAEEYIIGVSGTGFSEEDVDADIDAIYFAQNYSTIRFDEAFKNYYINIVSGSVRQNLIGQNDLGISDISTVSESELAKTIEDIMGGTTSFKAIVKILYSLAVMKGDTVSDNIFSGTCLAFAKYLQNNYE